MPARSRRRGGPLGLAALAATALTLAALPVLRSADGGSASAGTVRPGRLITLAEPVLPIPAPAGKIPFAQYQEMHANCKPVNQAADDPIVFPGLPGACTTAHLHRQPDHRTPSPRRSRWSAAAAAPARTQGHRVGLLVPHAAAERQAGAEHDESPSTTSPGDRLPDGAAVPGRLQLLVGDMKTPDAASFGGNWDCGNYGGTTRRSRRRARRAMC